MKKTIFCLALLPAMAFAQNLTTVSGANIQDLNGAKLASGQLCFVGTDNQGTPISFEVGGGGQVLKRKFCSQVTAGVVTSFTVPNPANTLPTGIYYHITVVDSVMGQTVLDYPLVSFTGGTFNFDNYVPVNLSNPASLSGTAVPGSLSVAGNVAATGTVTGSNIPGSIPGVGACTNQFVRALNNAAPPTCSTVGTADLAASLGLVTPNIGAATGTSLNLSGAMTAGSYTNNLSAFAATTSAQLAGIISDESGSGSLVFANTPSLITPILGAATGTSLNLGATGVLSTTAQSGTGSLCMTTNCSMTTPTLGAATATSLTTATITQTAATQFLIKDNSGGTRFSIPSGGTTPATLNNTNIAGSSTLTSPSVITGISQGSGLKHQRFGATCTTGTTGGSSCTTIETWTSAFADANYTLTCSGITAANSAFLDLESITASTFTVRVFLAATAGAGASFAGVDCIAIHD